MYAAAYAVLLDDDDALDAVQESFVSLWENRDRLDSMDSLAGYCVTVARRKAIDRLRRRSLFADNDNDIAAGDPREPSPAADVKIQTDQQLEYVTKLIRRLPPQQQLVMTLSAFAELSNSEIARQTGLSEGNVRVLLCRARQQIRNSFSQYYD